MTLEVCAGPVREWTMYVPSRHSPRCNSPLTLEIHPKPHRTDYAESNWLAAWGGTCASCFVYGRYAVLVYVRWQGPCSPPQHVSAFDVQSPNVARFALAFL